MESDQVFWITNFLVIDIIYQYIEIFKNLNWPNADKVNFSFSLNDLYGTISMKICFIPRKDLKTQFLGYAAFSESMDEQRILPSKEFALLLSKQIYKFKEENLVIKKSSR